MKKNIHIYMLMIAMFLMLSCSSASPSPNGGKGVYICVTGEVYHEYRDCYGLSNATHEIKLVPLSEAQRTRRACKICY